MENIKLPTGVIPEIIPNKAFAGMGQYISEGPIQGQRLLTNLAVFDETAIRAKVNGGTRLEFQWRNGNTYAIPVEAARFYDFTWADELGIQMVTRAVQLQLVMSAPIEDYEV